MQEREHVGLPKAGAGHHHLAEEITLPKGVGVDLDELVPRAGSTLGARVDTFFLENSSDSRATNAADPQLPQFADDPGVAPLILLGEADDDLADRLGSTFPAHLLRGRLPLASPLQPTAVGSWMNN